MFVLVLAGAMLLTVMLRAFQTGAQEGLPTPEGRLGGAISIATQPVEAQPRTPTPVARRPDIPDPDECGIEPRTIDGMLALAATPAPDSSPVAFTAPATTPSPAATAAPSTAAPAATDAGRPATAAMIGQIQRTVRELVACGNAGDLLRVWAFFTDDFVASEATEQGILFNRTILTARVRAQGERQDAMPTISTVRSFDDGRLSAELTLPPDSPFAFVTGETGEVTCVFAQENGRWRIAEVHASDGTGGP